MKWNEAATGSSSTVQGRARAGTHHTPPRHDCLAGSVRLRAAPAPPESQRQGRMSRGRGHSLGPLTAPSPDGSPSGVPGTGSAQGTGCRVGAAGCTPWPPAPWLLD